MGVLTTWCGKAGIGLGHLLGREHDSTPQSGVEAPRGASASPRKKNGASLDWIIVVLGGGWWSWCMWGRLEERERRGGRRGAGLGYV